MKQIVTLAEICDALGLADSSARRYVKAFKAFFPIVSEGFPVRYRGEAVEIMGMIAVAMKERHSRTEIEEALARAGYSRDVEKSSPPVFTTSPLAEILNERVVKIVAKSVTESLVAGQQEALEVNRCILAALERQNELLEQLTRSGMTLPGVFPSNSHQEDRERPDESPSAESAETGHNELPWWKRLFGCKD